MKRPESQPKGAPEWMVTYSDVVSLLVTFFVMLLTFSTTDDEQFDKAAGALRGALGVTMEDVSRMPQSGMLDERYLVSGRSTPMGMDLPPEFGQLETELTKINQRLKNERRGASITLKMLRRGVMIRMDSPLVFVWGTARFAPGAHDNLMTLARIAAPMRNRIEIVVHAGPEIENLPGATCPWELTQEQAAAIADFMQRQAGIEPARLAVSGMGRSTPLAGKPSHRDSRIEILLMEPER